MKLDALDHPKTLDFASRLNVSRPTAIGHLELLWAFTGKQSAQGNIGKWPDGAIARACDWMGPADAFINALVESGLVDRDSSFRLTVHDWSDHAPGWVRAKLKKVGLPFIDSSGSSSDPSSDGSSECSSDDTEVDFSTYTSSSSSPPESVLRSTSEPSSRAPVLKGREGKGREVKCSQGKGGETPLVNGHSHDPPNGKTEIEKNSPQTRSPRTEAAARKNGSFERINDAVSKLLTTRVCNSDQVDDIAKIAGITRAQARESLKQLGDRGQLA